MQKLVKDAEKPRKLPSYPSTSSQMSNFNSFNPFPALTNLQALHQMSTRSPPAPPAATQLPYKSPSNENPTGISPLDLSSSSTPPLAKRIKLSPTSTETQRQQQTTSPNVTTTNNQLTSGCSTSSSSSTTSNNSEQAGTQPARKCQMKIDEINAWNVDDVCSFVESIAICAEYVKVSWRFIFWSFAAPLWGSSNNFPSRTATASTYIKPLLTLFDAAWAHWLRTAQARRRKIAFQSNIK